MNHSLGKSLKKVHSSSDLSENQLPSYVSSVKDKMDQQVNTLN